MKVYLHTGLAVLLAGVTAAGAAAATPQAGTAQQPLTQEDIKRLVGEPITVTATVVAIDYNARLVVLRGKDGKDEALFVGDDVKRFANMKVGDRVSATYYASLALQLLQPGEKPGAGATIAAVGATGDKPGATIAAQRRITATISAIDMANQTVTLTGEQGNSVVLKAANKDRLAKVKTGDRIEVVMTAAALVRVEAAK